MLEAVRDELHQRRFTDAAEDRGLSTCASVDLNAIEPVITDANFILNLRDILSRRNKPFDIASECYSSNAAPGAEVGLKIVAEHYA